MPPEDDMLQDLIAAMSAQYLGDDDPKNRQMISAIGKALKNIWNTESFHSEDDVAIAAFFEPMNKAFSIISSYLVTIGLYHQYGSYDDMIEVLAAIIPDETLIDDFCPYSWAEVKGAHYRVPQELLEQYSDNDEAVECCHVAGEKLCDCAQIISRKAGYYGIKFDSTIIPEDKDFAEQVGLAAKDLGITAALQAYLSGDVPVEDIVA